jgi:UDP-N-acetylglucosamine 4,6-dehydratase/5-epimerase
MHILITGGTGTFGNAAAKEFLDEGHTVTIYSRDEQKQEQMAARFKHHPDLQFFLGDVRDKDRLRQAMRGRDAVIHAAALKIVPKCEFDPLEAVKTNIIGTANVIEAALDCGTERAILISTDKAVDPVNLYGTTKKTAEHLFLAANNFAKNGVPMFSVARYGNVWRSRGSVIEIWEKCAAEKKPIQITDPDMTRFFMTAEQAVDLVKFALREMQGGEIFIPKLRAYRLYDLAKSFCTVHGCGEITTQPRSGEKIGETLISDYELPRTIFHGTDALSIWPGSSPDGNTSAFRFFAKSDSAPRMTPSELLDWIRK